MFGWSAQPKCPVDSSTKQWIERQLNWLAERFGFDQLLDVNLILPNADFFPEDYYAHPKHVLRLLRRVCRYVQVDRKIVKFKTFKDYQLSRLARREEAAAHDKSHHYLWFRESLLDDPVNLIGALARELTKIRMLVAGYVTINTCEVDNLAELATIGLGMGILTANTSPTERKSDFASVPGWSQDWQGDVSGDMFGYALALFAWYRGERHAEWPQHLRGDVLAAYKVGFDYLDKTGDSMFRPIGYSGPQNH